MGKQWLTIFLGSKITAACDCSHEIKTLTLWKESYDQPRQHIKKQRRFFVNKDLSSQANCFSSSHVWMWELDYKETWAPKNWCFWTVVLEKTLVNPWTARRSNQSILKEISPGCSLVGLMLKLKLQYCSHPMRRADSFEKMLMLGKIEGRRRRQQRMGWLDGITDSVDMGLGRLRQLVMDRKAWCAVVHEVTKRGTQLGHWTELYWILLHCDQKRCLKWFHFFFNLPRLDLWPRMWSLLENVLCALERSCFGVKCPIYINYI